jgi:uncharacterized protein
MEQRMNTITLGVSDLKRSREFYERLGWRRSMAKSNDIVFFQMGGMALGLYPSDELAKDATVPSQGDGFRRFTLAYCARTREEVKTILEEAQRAGAKLVKPAQDVFWGGHSGYFADPDGFLWEVAWNPFFPVEKDGSIKLPD